MDILIDGLRFYTSSPLRHLVHLYLPRYWLEYDSDEARACRSDLRTLARRRGVGVDFDVEDEGNRINRATKAACFDSDFWLLIDTLKAREKFEEARVTCG
jgi:hypothetical protein